MMSKRIKEIADECRIQDKDSKKKVLFDEEKFAQLIVKECVTVASYSERYGIEQPISKQLKEYFEVK